MTPTRHRAGLIGAGHISPYHAAALRRVAGVQLAGIYDADIRRAQALAARLGTTAVTSVEALAAEGADVMHVLTPPDTHAELAIEALRSGAHVLVEKPLATSVEDCERIGATAQRLGLRVCVDHSLLYDRRIRAALRTARSGGIGRVLSVDILRGAAYGPYTGGPLPPQYRSAGYPFRDLGVHQLYLFAAFLGPIEDVRADWSQSGGDPNLAYDEWYADVRCRDGRGHVHIAFNARPHQNLILVQGTRGILRIEQMSMLCTRRVAMPIPKAFERAANAYGESLQTVLQMTAGMAGALVGSVRQYDGVQRLVAEFYRSLDAGLPVPVSVEEATPIVGWVERIARVADASISTQSNDTSASAPVLVTGAAGALGSAVVERLRQQDRAVRAFVRRQSARAMPGEVQTVIGDLRDPEAVDRSVRGCRIVIHAGAAMRGNWAEQHSSTVIGTQNVIEACLRHGVEQLVYISSLSVVDWAGNATPEPISESSPLEPRAQLRGAYTRAKLEAEQLVRRAVSESGLRAVILRPGQIVGGKLPLLNDAIARRLFGHHIVLGDGGLQPPLVCMDDVVDGICSAMERTLVDGEVIQLVDDELPTQNDILNAIAAGGSKPLRIPRSVVFALASLSELACLPLRRASPFSRYRLRSALARRSYRSQHADRLLAWKPRIGVRGVMSPDASGAG